MQKQIYQECRLTDSQLKQAKDKTKKLCRQQSMFIRKNRGGFSKNICSGSSDSTGKAGRRINAELTYILGAGSSNVGSQNAKIPAGIHDNDRRKPLWSNEYSVSVSKISAGMDLLKQMADAFIILIRAGAGQYSIGTVAQFTLTYSNYG